MIKPLTIVVHRNSVSPFPMYFYPLEEYDDPAFGGNPGFWYGLYVLPDYLALQVGEDWSQFHHILAGKERQFVVDVGLPMYVDLNGENVIETFEVAFDDKKAIRRKMAKWIFGGKNTDPGEREISFLYHPEYLAAFRLTKRAQGLNPV